MMEYRVRATHEQFIIMLEFMEMNGDLSRPQPGAQGKVKAGRLWNELVEILNLVGVNGVQKEADKWKRVWSDWKTKTKKKAATINKMQQGTGGGPSTVRPLTPVEERVLKIMGVTSIIGNQEVQETGFELPLSQPAGSTETNSLELSAEEAQIQTENNLEKQDDQSSTTTQKSPSSTPRRHRRTNIGQHRRQRLTPFERATKEFVRIEEGRLELDKMSRTMEHEREMARIKLEAEKNEKENEREIKKLKIESQRNEIFQTLSNEIQKLLNRHFQ